MTDSFMVWIVLIIETLVAGGFTLLIPRVTRRGLLFGVYVGEQQSGGDEARAITRGWYVVMIAALAASVVLGTSLTLAHPEHPAGALSSLFLLLAASLVSYLWAHFRARALATTGAPKSAAAFVVESPQALTVPIIATCIAMVGGAIALGYAWLHYGEMPEQIPTHFGASGLPDSWAPRSFWSIMLLPLLTAFVCPATGVMACLTARAKRAIRQADQGVSFGAQMRFRRAMSLFLSGTVVLITLMLGGMSISSVQVALGLSAGLSMWTMVMTGVLVVYAVGGSLYMMLHFGQGGARLERSAAGAPLTNGLADNEHWVLGMFYVNRDDPSFMVEKRFGVGYTINLGNPWAVTLVALFFIFLIGVLWFARSMPHTGVPPRS